MVFENKDALLKYIPHKEHQKVVQVIKQLSLDSPCVIDHEIE